MLAFQLVPNQLVKLHFLKCKTKNDTFQIELKQVELCVRVNVRARVCLSLALNLKESEKMKKSHTNLQLNYTTTTKTCTLSNNIFVLRQFVKEQWSACLIMFLLLTIIVCERENERAKENHTSLIHKHTLSASEFRQILSYVSLNFLSNVKIARLLATKESPCIVILLLLLWPSVAF